MSVATLKYSLKANAFEAQQLRAAEQKALGFHRTIMGIASLKHQVGEARPNPVLNVPDEADEKLSEEVLNRYQNLRHRRTHALRKKARATYLAYGFLRGYEYSDIEYYAHEAPDLDRVERIIFDNIEIPTDVEAARTIIHDTKQRWERWRQFALGVEDEPMRKTA